MGKAGQIAVGIAVLLLGTSGCISRHPSTASQYEGAFRRSTWKERTAALIAFGKCDEGNLDFLKERLFNDPTPGRRIEVMDALCQFVDKKTMTQLLWRAFQLDPSGKVRASALVQMWPMKGEGIRITKFMKVVKNDPEEVIRVMGLSLVSRDYGASYIAFYEEMLLDSSSRVRMNAMVAVRKYGTSQSAAAVRDMLMRYDKEIDKDEIIAASLLLVHLTGLQPPKSLSLSEEAAWWIKHIQADARQNPNGN